MGMIKVVPTGSWDFDVEPVQLIKVAHSGLRGSDMQQLIKRASHSFADAVRRADIKPGDIPVHVIALGATEFYGPNRNGDGFKEATCRQHHDSFVKHARWYRNHQNKDPEKSYGFIKHSEFNDKMKRVELLAILNGTKEAAARNGGLVADEEIKSLEEGKDIPTSMACKVAYDVCAGCGNKAKNRSEYCSGEDEGGMCKRGGCKHRLTFVHDDGFQNYVDNPDPLWFDNSRVFRGADRIAFTNGIVKAANGLFLGGAELAEKLGVELPSHIVSDRLRLWPTQIEKLAIRLARYELEFEKAGSSNYDWTFSPTVQQPVSWEDHGSTKNQAFSALMLHKIVMPIEGFAEMMFGKEALDHVEMARRNLPGIYNRMMSDVFSYVTDPHVRQFLPCGSVPQPLMKWAADKAADYSLDKMWIEQRAQRAALYGATAPVIRQSPLVKVAGAAQSLARDYALYKMAFLQALVGRDSDFDLTASLVVRQNYL